LRLDGSYYYKYTRVYKKISDILPQVFGIIHPLMHVFSFFVDYITKYNLDNFLVNKFLCYFTKEKNEDNKIVWKCQNFKDFKNMFKNFKLNKNEENNELFNNKINSEINSNEGIKRSMCESNFTYIDKKEAKLRKKAIQDISNINLSIEESKVKMKNDNIDQMKIEMVNKTIKEYINLNENSNRQGNPSGNLANLNNEINQLKNKKENIFNYSFKFSLKEKSDFPYIGFIDYYLPFLLPKKDENYKSRINNSKILKYFSIEILNKMDLIYYLKLVRTLEIMKNS